MITEYKHCDEFNNPDGPLIAQAPAMYELLKDIEFVEDGVTTWCPCCGENPPGHSSDCRLAAVLKAVEGECPPPSTTD